MAMSLAQNHEDSVFSCFVPIFPFRFARPRTSRSHYIVVCPPFFSHKVHPPSLLSWKKAKTLAKNKKFLSFLGKRLVMRRWAGGKIAPWPADVSGDGNCGIRMATPWCSEGARGIIALLFRLGGGLDPFCGSGTMLVAGLDAGTSRVIGIDREKKYLAIARRRISNE